MTPRQRTSRAAAALTLALQAGRAALLLVIALAVPVGVTHAQEWLPDAVIVVTTPQVGVMEDASVEVIIPTGMDFPLTLDWGDGTSDYVDHHGALTQQFTHAYLTAGVKVLELLLEDPFENETYLIDTDVIVVGSSAELDVYPTVVDVDETVTAEVTAGDTGGRLSWGDGAFELLAGGDETFTHAYGASGTYLVELSGPAGELRAATTVSVAAAPLAFDVQPTAEVGEEVVATLEGLVANAPTGARLAWGDGGIDVALDDGPITHTYLRPGTYVVRLETLPDSRLLALHTITVDAGGSLDLPDDALLLGATRIAGRGLAPGMTYELKLGDGTTVVRSADALGGIAVEHTYTTALLRFDVDLTLVEGGQRTPIDAGRIDLRLPAAGETLRVTQAAIPGMAGLRLTVSADGLLPGVEYQVTGPAFGTATVTRAAPEAGSATVDVYAEGPVDIALDAVLKVATGGFQTVRRADTTFLASWIRDETLTVTGPYERVLDTDVLVVTAARLQAGFGYDIVVNGDRERPYRLNPAQSAALAVPGTWQVDLPLVVLGPDVTLELFARLPTGDGIQLDLRAIAAVSATVPTGSLALPEPVVPYAVASPVFVRDLTAGLPYRLEFPGDRVERFTAPDDGAVDFAFAFGLDQGQLELFVDREGAGDQPIATLAHAGVTFVGRMGYTYDVDEYLENGAVTLLVRGVAPGFDYSVTMDDGRRYQGTADEHGRLDLPVTHPDVSVYLHMHALDDEFYVARVDLVDLVPRTLSFHGSRGWQVKVTSIVAERGADMAEGEDEDLIRLPVSLRDLTGTGTLENFVVGGRLQDPIPVTFDGVDAYFSGTVRSGNADITEPVDLALPQAVRGVSVRLTRLVLGPAATFPDIGGSVALPNGEVSEFERVMTRYGSPSDGFIVQVGSAARTQVPIGSSGWSFGAGSFGGAVLDLDTSSNYNFRDTGGIDALTAAYGGYQEVGRSSPTEPYGRWVGLLYPRAELRLGTGGDSYSSFTAHLAWTSAGASTMVAVPIGDGNGSVTLGDWTFHDVTGLELVVVDDQVVRFTRPSGLVTLPWFGQDVPVSFTPTPGALGGWSVRTLAPVATDYGGTAVVGGVGTFVRTGVGTQALRFPNALWALDGDLAADPATIDSSAGDALIASLPEIGTATEDLQEAYDDAVATSETALNLYKLQLLLKDLTLHADGSVDLGGREWRTLAKVPALDMFGFPYLGAGAEIGVRRDGDSYGIGLRGELKLGDAIEANAAPSWYVHSGGKEEQWRFEGVGVKFGDFEGSPVTFSVVVGGVVDLQRLALSFTGAGSLTIPDVLSIEALALFGVVEQDGPIPVDFFWFVSAGVDLATMGRPININVQGVDVLAFYAFRGGIASHLRIDVGGGDCRVDDGNVPELILPSIATNALDCYDPALAVSFLGGTVIGSPVQGGAGSQGYGILWHLDTNLVINLGKGGDLQLAGQGWIGKNLDDGYRKRGIEPHQLAGRLVINSGGITGSLCAGPVPATSSIIDCSGLAPARIMVGGLRLAEFKGAMGFTASWSTGQYFLALGTMYAPISMYVIPRETSGYFITGYIKQPNILHPNVGLPAGGVWVGANTGFSWSYEKSGKVWPCTYRVYANAGFGFGGAVGVQAVPSFRLSASINAYAYANAGGRVCGEGLDVGASIRAEGRFAAPNPTEFRGDFHVSIKLPVIKDINVTIRNVGVTIN